MPDPPSAEIAPDSENTSQFVSFQLGDQRYAFRIEQVREIVILDQITRAPQVARCVLGVSNLRGSIIPIVDLRILLGLPHQSPDQETRTIVVNVGDRMVGCNVDMVSQVIRIADDSIQPTPETLLANGNHDVAGFAKVDDVLLIVLNVESLLSTDRLQFADDPDSTVV
jgi:purine-binding chemotaxis protein CheW